MQVVANNGVEDRTIAISKHKFFTASTVRQSSPNFQHLAMDVEVD